jgi:hypothetical protein
MRALLRLALALLFTATVAPAASAQADDPGRLYGRVVTLNGTEFVGFIRWDNNEGHWTDQLDASKRLPHRFMREAVRLRRSLDQPGPGRDLGIRVGRESTSQWPSSASSAIRFGHIREILVLDDSHGLVVLKSGEEQELSSSSTDLGRGLQVLVEDANGSKTELGWDDIDYIEFGPAPRRTASPFGERLYAALTTRAGDEFSGWITWDRDELFGEDELDGDEDGRRRSIAFGTIASVEAVSSNRALVKLRDGRQMELSGTNDVNSENRGIFISDPALGRVEVKWGQLAEIRFHEPPSNFKYEDFDGGRRLRGTVVAEDGRRFTGTVRWDNDEEWTWEMLNGNYREMEVQVEFGMIASIDRVSSQSARVTLLDGREFVLRGSNDVNNENKGIFVDGDDGKPVMLRWGEFQRIDFHN